MEVHRFRFYLCAVCVVIVIMMILGIPALDEIGNVTMSGQDKSGDLLR